MRKLAPSEKTLFLVLCGAVFLAVNLISLKVFLNINEQLQSKISTLRNQLVEGRAIIMTAEKLQPAIAWMHEHPLPIWNNDKASAELLKCERTEAEKAGLKIIEENLLPTHSSFYATSVSVQAKISGSFDGLVKFLFALQTPTAWRVINKFIIKSDSDPTKVIIDLEMKQYFQTPATS
jgi:hypothetical protein